MFKVKIGLAIAAASALLLAGCGGGAASTTTSPAASAASSSKAKTTIAYMVNGPLGDQGFFDDGNRGITKLGEQGHAIKVVQSEANNPAQWKANLESISGKYDIIVLGSSQMTDILNQTAAKFPNQKYIFFDDQSKAPNVANLMFKQNEGSFVAGLMAGLVTTNKDKFPNATGSKIVGLVGGMDIPVINDFIVGFKKGVETVDPSIQVKVSFVGNFTDSNKGYDQAKLMYSQGADVVYQVAGGAGLGVLKAAADAKRYAIGVDKNQNATYPGFILASMLKNIGDAVVQAVNDSDAGKLKYGATNYYGIANKGVGLTFDNNNNIVPADMVKKLNEYADQVAAGKITVPTVFTS